jgi:hypothetical protein
MVSRVLAVGIACDGTLTMGVRVPYQDKSMQTLDQHRRKHHRAREDREGTQRETYIVIEQHQPLLGSIVLLLELLGVEDGRLVSHVVSSNVLEQLLDDRGRPGMRGVRGDSLEHGLVSGKLFLLVHLRRKM